MQHGPCTSLCKGKHAGRTALWVLWHWLVSSHSWMWQQLVILRLLRILVPLRILVCPGSFLLTDVSVPAQQHPVCGDRLPPHADKVYKMQCKWNIKQAAGRTQAGLQIRDNSQKQIYQMFQPHKGATCLSYCRNCVLPPVVLASCKNAGKWRWFESYFPFLKLVLP